MQLHFRDQKGAMLIQVIAFLAIGVLMLSGIMGWGLASVKLAKHTQHREQALQVAEGGIDYYRWHLAHDATDFYDGQGATSTGPYVHDFLDKDGVKIGQFALTITPPPPGSSIVTIKSRGTVDAEASAVRTIVERVAKPSYAKYAFVTNATSTYYGLGDNIYGELYSNGVLRFDSPAKAHSLVTSMIGSTTDPFYGKVWGASCTGDPTPPTMYTNASCPSIFLAGRTINAPQISFNNLALDLSSLRTKAIANGNYYADSGAKGYVMVLKTNDTYDLYRVDTVKSTPGGCSNVNSETGWGIWSVNTKTLLGNYAFPSDGIIFVTDDLWLEGQIDGAHITIAAGRNAGGGALKPNANIIINNNLLYTNKDGSDAIGAIAENSFIIGLYSADNLEIDAAIIAEKGATRRNYYSSNCSATYYKRTSLKIFGMMVSNLQGYFVWTSGGFVNSGYAAQPVQYDGNLLYAPPPSFPLTTDQYQIISWDEI
jgi:hypothetical protein